MSEPSRYESALHELARCREDIVVLTAENRAHVRHLPAWLGPRFVDVGICEQTLVGMAAGLAARGRTPICHALAPFLTMRAFEFIRTDVGLSSLPVKLVGFVPGILSDGNGPTHQSLEDIGLMRLVPGMQIFSPSDEHELLEGLPALLDSSSPCYIRYNARPLPGRPRVATSPGEAQRLFSGSDVVLLTHGVLLEQALLAREQLHRSGISAGVLHMPWVCPLDETAVLESARTARLLVTIEDHFQVGGLYSAVSECLTRRRQPAHLCPIAFEKRWFTPAVLPAVLEREALTGAAIAERISRLL